MRKRGKALNGGSHFFPCCSVCVTNRFVNDQQIDIITRHLIRRGSITSLVMKEGRSVIGQGVKNEHASPRDLFFIEVSQWRFR